MELIDHSKEIEYLKVEIVELKKDEKIFNQLNSHLSSLQQKFEKLQEEKKINEENLEDKLAEFMDKLNEQEFAKNKLENELINLSTSLKNKKLMLEEQNELILQKRNDQDLLDKTLFELKETFDSTQISLNQIRKEQEEVLVENKEKEELFQEVKEKLKSVLVQEKDLTDKNQGLEMKILETGNEISCVEKEIQNSRKIAGDLDRKLDESERELEQLGLMETDLENEIAQIRERNDGLLREKETWMKRLKTENQRNFRLESELSQLNFCLKNSEENLTGLKEKLVELEGEIRIREEEREDIQNENEEAKQHLVEIIQKNQEEVLKVERIRQTSKNVIKLIENTGKENVLNNLRNEFNRILTN